MAILRKLLCSRNARAGRETLKVKRKKKNRDPYAWYGGLIAFTWTWIILCAAVADSEGEKAYIAMLAMLLGIMPMTCVIAYELIKLKEERKKQR